LIRVPCIAIVAVERRRSAELTGQRIRPCVFIQNRSVGRIKAVAVQAGNKIQRNTGDTIDQRSLKQLGRDRGIRGGHRNWKTTEVRQQSAELPILYKVSGLL